MANHESVHVTVCKASAMPGRPTPDLLIEACEEFPDASPADAKEMHQAAGQRLGEALVKTLPGGTIDQLLAWLLLHQASLYRVAHRAGGSHGEP